MGNNKICAQKGNNLYSKNRIENYKINRLLPNYAMIERFLITKKMYHERQQFVKSFFEMLQIGAFFVFGGNGTAVHFWGAGGLSTVFL